MKHIREVTSRFRLVWSLAALVVLLGALSVTPVRADPDPLGCQDQCWQWNANEGCTNCHICCVNGVGDFNCSTTKDDKFCGTGGPGIVN